MAAIGAGTATVWLSLHPEGGWARLFFAALFLLLATLSFFSFRLRHGRFVMEGNKCTWNVSSFQRQQRVLDFSDVTSLVYESPDVESQSFFVQLRDGSKIKLPPEYLFRAGDITAFMDFVARNHPHIKIIGRDLLPNGRDST